MAKYKKKKSLPTPDPDKSEKEETPPIEDGDIQAKDREIPPTEDGDIQAKDREIPPTEKADKPEPKPVSESQTPETKKKLDRLFWLRVALAAIGGIVATFIFEPIEGEERRWTSIGFMITLFIVSIFLGKSMNLQLPRSDRKKLVTTGIGSYVFIYLFMWILSYTLVNLPSIGGDIPSPIS